MQLTLAIDGRSRTIGGVHRRLHARFGRQGPWQRLDPVDQLVVGILGGRTRGEVSLAAFVALRARFGGWEAVRDAPFAEVLGPVGAVTFADDKARRLKAALAAIAALRGAMVLDFLGDMTVEDALAWLERLPGVGRKAAAATLNFSTLAMPALVIDTHHLRVLRRLGLADPRADARRTYDRIVADLPAEWSAADMDEHHQLVKRLGQTICRHDWPACRRCPLADICPTAAAGTKVPEQSIAMRSAPDF